jgi:hypothetical protein
VITLRLDMDLCYQSGDLEQYGKASIYRGPVLLCSDSRFQRSTPTIDVGKFGNAKLVPVDADIAKTAGDYRPWIVVDVPTAAGGSARLIDFASAGATSLEGQPISKYVSWLPAAGLGPPPPVALLPPDRAKLPLGPIRFTWRTPTPNAGCQYEVLIAESPDFSPVVVRCAGSGSALDVPAEQVMKLRPGHPYYWKLRATNPHGAAESIAPWKQFMIEVSNDSNCKQ